MTPTSVSAMDGCLVPGHVCAGMTGGCGGQMGSLEGALAGCLGPGHVCAGMTGGCGDRWAAQETLNVKIPAFRQVELGVKSQEVTRRPKSIETSDAQVIVGSTV